MASATYFRTKKDKDNPYVMIDKRPVENPALSWKAKGMLAYLLSRPDGWEIWIEDLVNRSTDGESSVRAGLKELREAGHIVYAGRERKAGQVKKAVWEVHEVPRSENRETSQDTLADPVSPDSENHHQVTSPNSEKPNVEKPNVENRTLNNIDNNNKDRSKSRKTSRTPIALSLSNQIAVGMDTLTESDVERVEKVKAAVAQHFKLNINWSEPRTRNRSFIPDDFVAYAFSSNITAEEIERAAEIWFSDKRFNFMTPTLKQIWEKWPLLLDTVTEQSGEKWWNDPV